ncbi:hypothetical protein MKW94_001966 [Papaver nudicaule]|uniref:nucleoside-diphosphate kinase n=1 Tax=Papaver nudicaule TaxID=74823 RepID=A0AA41SLL0_PAPNU|nr:hypothetical protein [Papaver nudicaule]
MGKQRALRRQLEFTKRIEEIQRQNQQAFVLAYPVIFSGRYMGDLVSIFEEKNLNLKGMRLMNVNEKFVEKHFKNVGGEPQGANTYGTWLEYLTCHPVIAMILEGYDAVRRVQEITSERDSLFWSDKGPTAYSSNTVVRAQKDIEMWFQDEDWLRDAEASTHLVYLHPEGKTYGPAVDAYNILKSDVSFFSHHPNIHGYFMLEYMSVVVIKPEAFRKCCVGDILSAVEGHCAGIRGLKLVRKADCPGSSVWSDSCTSSSTTDGDECTLAMVVLLLSHEFELTYDEPDTKHIDFDSGVYRLGSKYIYQSEKGDNMWSDVVNFFPHGFTLWVDPTWQQVFGKMFEASLVGLVPVPDPESEVTC